ncbi:MAG: T9SS type A sorting domain-containing protein [Bacteroidetes bacterium]|nr:T9SS type A sorting domain-containing protein [Bacteroidota bacterium]
MRTLLLPLSLLGCLGFVTLTGLAHAQSVPPVFVDGNPTCGDAGYSDEFAFKIDFPPFDGTHDIIIDGDVVGEVTVHNPPPGNPDDHFFTWESTLAIHAVIAKGGPNANIYHYAPSATEDLTLPGLVPPFNVASGMPYDISHIDFCIDPPTGCEFNLRVMNPEVDPGDALGIMFHLQHNRLQTVRRAFFLEILDTDRTTVLFRRQSRMYEIAYQDEINRNWALNLPNLEPGVYSLQMGIEGMTQGRVLAWKRFVVRPGARQAAPSSVALPEQLDGEWIAVAAAGALPSDYVLTQNYPNPFNPATEIGFALPESAHVRLVVYDVLGRQVRLLLDGTMEAGTHQVVFDASDLPSGTYLYRLETPQGSVVRTMLLAK